MNFPRAAILHYTAPPIIGGVEMVMQAHARAFREAGYPLAVIAGRGDRSALPRGVEFISIAEMDSLRPSVSELNRRLERGELPSVFEEVVTNLERILDPILARFDVVIAHNLFSKHFNLPLTAALYRLLDKGTIRRCIAWCHDISWTSPRSRTRVHHGYPWDLLRTFRPDVIYVAVSGQRKLELVELFGCRPEKIRVIFNGVDANELLGISRAGQALAGRLGLWESDLNLLMPVRVTRAKNFEYAAEVLAAIKSRGYNPRLVVTGPPDPHDEDSIEYYQSLLELRRELNVERELLFVYESGPQPEQPYTIGPEVVGDLYRLSDVMFMPSHREGFGMPVLEAGLAGALVVATPVPAVREIASEDVLQFTLSERPTSLANSILNHMEAYPSHRFRRRIRQDFSWTQIFKKEIEPLLADGKKL